MTILSQTKSCFRCNKFLFSFPCRNINCCHYLMTCYQTCSRIVSGKEKDGRLEKLYVKKESNSADSPSQLFVDTAVYSRNRCFRLALSSKAGKTSVLLPTGRYRAKNMVWYAFYQEYINLLVHRFSYLVIG